MKELAPLSLPPGPDTVPRAMAWLEGIARQQQWDARTAFKLNLCLDEALTNIVMYAFSSGAKATAPRIELGVTCDDRRIVLNLVDNGVAFDPTQSTPGALAGSLDEADPGGHGLRILQHYLEHIEYRRVDGRNHLYLTIARDSTGPRP